MEELRLSPGIIGVLGKEDPASAVTAALGPEAGLYLLPREPMLEPRLSMEANCRLLRMNTDPEKAELLDRLVDLSGLKKQGWTRPFRKDMDGERQIWKILLTLVLGGSRVLLPEALVGMNGDMRKRLDEVLAAWTAEGRTAILTLGSLKEALSLPSLDTLWLCRGEGIRSLSRERAETYRDREEELWKEAET